MLPTLISDKHILVSADDFKAKLLVYSPRAILPTGAVGDPAMDYSSNRDGHCGKFQPGDG